MGVGKTVALTSKSEKCNPVTGWHITVSVNLKCGYIYFLLFPLLVLTHLVKTYLTSRNLFVILFFNFNYFNKVIIEASSVKIHNFSIYRGVKITLICIVWQIWRVIHEFICSCTSENKAALLTNASHAGFSWHAELCSIQHSCLWVRLKHLV